MIKNTSGQSVSAQMINSTTGAEFTGAVTVYVTGDAGVQAVGSVGAGLCTHEGHGLHTYQPSQAETNYARVDFTFVGAGAITVTVQYATLTAAQSVAIGGTGGPDTWADVLTYMEMLNNELEAGSGEDDEVSALIACVAAQHQFEAIAASLPRTLGTVVNTTTTTTNTETTTWPTALLRLDGIFVLDSSGKVVRKIERMQEVGSHAPSMPWPLNLVSPAGGTPSGYFTDMANFYWLPLPDASYTLRIHGLFEATEPATRASSFIYPKRCKLAMAQMAVFLMKFGVDDTKGDLDKLGERIFRPLLRGLRKYDRSGPVDKHYDSVHTT